MKIKYPYNYRQYIKPVSFDDITSNSVVRKFIRIQRLVMFINIISAAVAITLLWGEL